MNQIQQTSDTTQASGWRMRRVAIGIAVLAGLAMIAVVYWALFLRGRIKTDDARIAGTMVDVSAQTSGALEKMLVSEGDEVSRGDALFTIDSAALEARLEQAAAGVSSAEAGVELSRDQLQKALHGPRRAEIMAARASEKQAAAALQLAERDLQRQRQLVEKGAGTQAVLERAQAAHTAAQQAHEQAQQRLLLLEQGTRSEDISAARTSVKLAESKLAQARAALASARVAATHATEKAPFSGVVVRSWLEPGAMATTGRPVLTLFDPDSVRVDANIEEQFLHDVAVGDRADIRIDAYPGHVLHGHVARILRATNSQFGLVPAEGVSGTFIKVAQRLPLRIELDHVPEDMQLGPGLSAEVTLYVGTSPADPTPAKTVQLH